MDEKNRVYYAQRAAEELELALAATDSDAAEAQPKSAARLSRTRVGRRSPGHSVGRGRLGLEAPPRRLEGVLASHLARRFEPRITRRFLVL